MPIHQTKLTMAKPQPIGMFTPQMPTPFTSRYAIETMSRFASANASRNPTHQPTGVLRVRTIALILSVTEPNVYPDAITGGVPLPTTAWFGSSIGIRPSVMFDGRQGHSPSSGFTFLNAAR